MDLSCWMEPDPRFMAAPLPWVRLCPDSEITRRILSRAPHLAAPSLRLERCLGEKDAAAQLQRPGVPGVYVISLAAGQAITGLERWTPETPWNQDPGEMLVSVSCVSGGISATGDEKNGGGLNGPRAGAHPCALDFLNPATAPLVLEAVQETRAASESDPWDTILPVHFSRMAHDCVAFQSDVIWTPDFPAVYQERWGEDPTDLLPYLWFDGPGASRFRWRFRSLMADLFRDRFLAPLASWAEDAGLRLLGCFESDTSLMGQVLEGWGPVMRFFEKTHIPGIAGERGVCPPVLAFAQALSAKAQLHTAAEDLGRNPAFPTGVRCAVYTTSGRHIALEEFRAEAEQCLAMGAGFLTPPDQTASLRGDGKRSSSVSLFHEAQPWWPQFELLNRSLGRLNYLLSQGRRRAEVLVLVPSESVMALAAAPLPGNMAGIAGKATAVNAQARETERLFLQLLQALEAFQIGYELADEELVERRGRAQANVFLVGAREYTTVVVPPAFSWRSGTLAKVRRFAKKGGSVILPRPFAQRTDLEPDNALAELAEEYLNVYAVERAGREVCFQVNRVSPPPCQIKSKTGQSTDSLVIQHRRTTTHDLFLIMNTSREADIEARVFFHARGAIRLLDPWAPRIFVREADEEKSAQVFDFTFHAGAAHLFAVGGESDLTEPPYQRMPHATSSVALSEEWDFERLDPNLLPLRTCRWSAGDGAPSHAMPVEFARMAMRGTAPRNTPVTLTFSFTSNVAGKGRDLALVVEPNAGMDLFVNGQMVSLETEKQAGDLRLETGGKEAEKPTAYSLQSTASCLFDPSFKKVDVAALIQRGRNEVMFRFPYGPDSVVESPVLAGQFGVSLKSNGEGMLENEPRTLRNGPLSEQGYPFYSGRMRYIQRFEHTPQERRRYFLALRKPAGSAFSLRIGDHAAVPSEFHPYRLEITRLALPGANTVQIEAVSSLYNLYGPVHLNPMAVDARDFSADSYDARPFRDRQLWSARPNLASFGLIEGAAIETFDPAAPPPQAPKEKGEGEEDEQKDEGRKEKEEVNEAADESMEENTSDEEEPEKDEEESEDDEDESDKDESNEKDEFDEEDDEEDSESSDESEGEEQD